MSEIAQLVLPAIRWSPDHGYADSAKAVDQALALGVGGFIIFGGTVEAARALIEDIRRRSSLPLLIAADLERGAGQQFEGATRLPPAAALAALGDIEVIRRAAQITAAEAQAIGINWVLAPVCDLDLEPENPIVGTRAFGGDPLRVAACAEEWIDACQAKGVLACAKHFPGHGRTTTDSHAETPVVSASLEELQATDLLPFREGVEAGVAAIMTAHVAYPALDDDNAPATLSRPILQTLLRSVLGFHGIIVTDAMIMEGLAEEGGELRAAVAALAAGCDILLYPRDVAGVVRAIEAAAKGGALDAEHLKSSIMRRARWAEWAAPTGSPDIEWSVNAGWAAHVAERVVHSIRGEIPRVSGPIELITVEDDVGGPYPAPSRDPFAAMLAESGRVVRRVAAPSGDAGTTVVIAVFGETRAWKGRAGYSEESRAAVEAACHAAPDAIAVQFAHPRLAASLPCTHVVCAWGGEAVMQRAAARWLLQDTVSRETLPGLP